MKDFGYVFASKMLLDAKAKVDFMYREPAEDADSGWRFFSGGEDQAYVDNPDNIVLCDVQDILAFDSSIRPYLNAVPGSAFERREGTDTFARADDYGFEGELED
ncbi:MAG: DUF2185 domain-containing protein [Defluviitaleaceae bacterium]|nr:DUF2185 domain-containing protein [Defluviitaleaceae bacterium]